MSAPSPGFRAAFRAGTGWAVEGTGRLEEEEVVQRAWDEYVAAAAGEGRWSTRHVSYGEATRVAGTPGWHVIGEQGDDPDPLVREVYDLHVQYAHDGDGGDCSLWLADRVARALNDATPTEAVSESIGHQDIGGRAAVESARLTLGEPETRFEWFDEDEHGHGPTVGWDLAFGCQVSIGYDASGLRAVVAMSDASGRGHEVRSVTEEQVRTYAAQLLALVTPASGESQGATEDDPYGLDPYHRGDGSYPEGPRAAGGAQ